MKAPCRFSFSGRLCFWATPTTQHLKGTTKRPVCVFLLIGKKNTIIPSLFSSILALSNIVVKKSYVDFPNFQ
jgi:hypothetical protein